MVEGPVYSADYTQFSSALLASLETTVPAVFDQYESVFVDIFGNEEYISMDG